MADTHWLEITSVCGHFGAVASTVANFILLFLLTILPPKALGAYKYLMIVFCLFSLFYTSVEIFLRPTTARAISSTYCGCYAMSFTLVAVHFIYRYFAVCKPENLKYFKNFYFAAWVFAAVSVAFSWGFAAFLLYPETERTRESLIHVVTKSYSLDPGSVGNVPYSYFRYDTTGEHLNPRNVIGILQHGVIMSLSFGTVFYCGILTYKSMNTGKRMSDKTKEMQRQLFNALVMQTVIPMAFMYLPTTMLFVTPFLGWNIGCYGNITVVTVHLYPGIDPLLYLFIIKDFRKTLFGDLKGKRIPRTISCSRLSSSKESESGNSDFYPVPRGSELCETLKCH